MDTRVRPEYDEGSRVWSNAISPHATPDLIRGLAGNGKNPRRIHALYNQIARNPNNVRQKAGNPTRENRRKLLRIHPNPVNTFMVLQLGSTSQTVVLKRTKTTAQSFV